MKRFLLSLGLIVTPFITIRGMNTRDPKMIAAIAIAMALGLLGIFNGTKPFKNKWVLAFVGFLLVNIFLCPKPAIVGAFWAWESLSKILIFLLMFLSVSSMNLDLKNKKNIINIMVWVGIAMSAYCILQSFGIDQFFADAATQARLHTPSYKICGTLGHPTLVSAFIAMIIPLSFYLKKYWASALMLVAVIITKSDIAAGALVLSLIFYIGLRNKKTAIITAILTTILASALTFAYVTTPFKAYIKDSGRFAMWADVFKSTNKPAINGLKQKYPITGIGIGSFGKIYHTKDKNNTWYQAHNEYLETYYNTGVIGFILFMLGWMTFFKRRNIFSNQYNKYLLTSFFCISVCAAGTFPWQLGAHAYYTITILGLLTQGEYYGIES